MQLLQKFNLMMLNGMQGMFNIMLSDGHLHPHQDTQDTVQVLPILELEK